MSKMKIGVIGAGNMGTAMIKGWLNDDHQKLAVLNPENPRVEQFCAAHQLPLFHEAHELIGWQPELLVFTTPAPVTLSVIKQFKLISAKVIMVSAAAGVKLTDLEASLPNHPWIRIIPNIPVTVNAGTIGITMGQNTKQHHELITKTFEVLGNLIEVREDQLNIVGTVGGCGPAFIDVVMDALGDAAVKHGLDREHAYQLAASMVAGSGKLALQTGLSPATLRDQVTSPGGTTIRGVLALEKHRVRYALIDAIDAASDN
ncbi:pyrroline-5-carboxylate reductase [Limosilactobacillus caecicola]|uniref:pyrroline-5-carboxylate reductase n=1 Tax=Limosilactobacillus caecicola TaxID=2941332 RepID=UPI00203F7A1C|nr:pyrroline-5-carboxylate reductase [Limosilactobacillus caecicola]